MSLEAALAKITSLPAKILGLQNRGTLTLGSKADITILDPARIEDRSTYTDSQKKPAGISYVIINGQLALAKGEQVGCNLGQVIFKGGLTHH